MEPEFIYNPKYLIYYCLKALSRNINNYEEVMLPWGCRIRVNAQEYIGRNIFAFGVFDLCVSEVIWRLLAQEDYAVDVGANIGYMTSIMAAKVGKQGNVVSFEPHPELFQELSVNIEKWQNEIGYAQITAKNVALSEGSGKGVLHVPDCHKQNSGLCKIISYNKDIEKKGSIVVNLERLDNFMKKDKRIGLLKIDVEGHEFEVLKGSSGLIEKHQIRDIIFEDHYDLAKADLAKVTNFLEGYGYELFYLGKRFFGLAVNDIKRKKLEYKRAQPEGASYLATIEPQRALSLLSGKGWSVLRCSHSTGKAHI